MRESDIRERSGARVISFDPPYAAIPIACKDSTPRIPSPASASSFFGPGRVILA
jgi:hypothetical protein